ncbi:hypothetical protein CEY16_03135 [Halalkalibacillus sediminis]|uniref:Uncharacterized protein n=1 Tax=Halalkalibacillus sediminis TaxID=2018042 RepID=A0A2I0QWS3_9BACI|nr:hypothetical protein [Halalkalibacillus sediminis]PKR78765.1 hypothetical protein CEY16_03135 [Halalkalibacillus sediminis]
MIRVLTILFLVPLFIQHVVYAEELPDIEVFDIQNEEVVQTIPNSDELQSYVAGYVETIDGVCTMINPIPREGFMIKTLFPSPLHVTNQWIDDQIETVIIILPTSDEPYLLMLNGEGRPYVFSFNADIQDFLDKIDFDPYNQ